MRSSMWTWPSMAMIWGTRPEQKRTTSNNSEFSLEVFILRTTLFSSIAWKVGSPGVNPGTETEMTSKKQMRYHLVITVGAFYYGQIRLWVLVPPLTSYLILSCYLDFQLSNPISAWVIQVSMRIKWANGCVTQQKIRIIVIIVISSMITKIQ